MEVFRTEPLLLQKVWGGRKLSKLFGKVLPDAAAPYGESWEVADLPEGQSRVATGRLAGADLRAAVKAWGAALTGRGGEQFPLLVKLLDAAADLSVQVHPGPSDEAVLRGEARSKDEFWMILASDGGAIVHGLRRTVSVAEFREAVARRQLAPLLQRVEVAPGDLFRVAPGTIHAICAGVCLLEVQQPSDTTYRVWDYNRPGLDGQPRALHLEDALAVATLGPSLPHEEVERGSTCNEVEVLADVEAYRIERFAPTTAVSWDVAPHTPQVLHVVRGSCVVDDVALAAGQTAIVPAAIGRVWLSQPDNVEVVVSGLGGAPLVRHSPAL